MTLRLRLLTANLWNGAAEPEAVARLLVDEQVDVACLQELAPEQAEAVADVLPFGWLAPARDGDGAGIAARAEIEVEPLPLYRRSLLRAKLAAKHWPGLARTLRVWNAHLWAPHEIGGLAIRRQQVRAILAALGAESPGPLTLAGDFNATPCWPAYRRIAARLCDAEAQVAAREGRRARRTWSPWSGPRRWRLLRIDHVFTRGIEVGALRRLPVPGSDHDALCADLTPG